jgi:hypothetical protein
MAVRTNILLKLSNFVDSLITFAKLQNIATNKILGRTTAGSGVIEELDIANYSNKLIPLTTTYADCENTTSEIDIITVTVPANSLAVGDIIILNITATRLQNGGAAVNLTQRVKINGNALYGDFPTSIPNNVTTFSVMQNNNLCVTDISGNNITLRGTTSGPTGIVVNSISFALGATGVANGTENAIRTVGSIDKTATITILCSQQWATANANRWIRVQQAQAYIIKKAV